MRRLFLSAVVLAVLCGLVFAEFPAEEIWHVDFDTTATGLGPSWEEDGQWYFLVGLPNKAVIVSEGEVVWESMDLLQDEHMPITTLTRVDFGTGDGPELIVCSGRNNGNGSAESILNAFTGNNYENRVRLSSPTIYPFYSLHHFTANNGDSTKPLIAMVNAWSEEQQQNGDYSFGIGGTIQKLSFGDSVVTLSSKYCGWSIQPQVIINNNQDYLLCGFAKHSIRRVGLYYDREETTVGIRLYTNNLAEQDSVLFHNYEGWSRDNVRYSPTIYGFTYSNFGDDEPAIYSCYSEMWGNNIRLYKHSFESFQAQDSINVPIAGILHNYITSENTHRLLIVNPNGSIGIINLDTFKFGWFDNIGHPHKASIAGNFDDDEEWELAWLSPSSFYLYDIGPLSVSPSSLNPYPSSLEFFAAYPNPFNSMATVEYALPHTGKYTITVHDLTGREITRLADGWNITGNYRAIWDATGIPSGAYMIRLVGDGHNAVRQVEIVK